MGVGSGPDLVVTTVTGPFAVYRDAAFTASIRVCNQGTDPSTQTSVSVYLSMDTDLTPDLSMPFW
ncbi:CARDB domain-containing protein [Myxococcus stipitatus]|uniref:CARDB domain-containing protein n=1 Tax=Myxococcus stipitatus TaxID=83455 RepID=UPI003AF22C1C